MTRGTCATIGATGIDPAALPATESLKDTLARAALLEQRIAPALRAHRNVTIVAHGNSLRALVKMLDGLSECHRRAEYPDGSAIAL
jgi:bisphosphoglycerate-dependent phosphoglycerate mutase